MIQRPQTIFFLTVLTLTIMMMFSDIVFYTVSDYKGNKIEVQYDETEIVAIDKQSTEFNASLWFVLLSSSIISLASIVSFKRRKLQASLCSFNFIAILLIVVLMYVYSFNMNYFEGISGELSFAALLPAALMFFNFLALRGIRKDERLVRSMDRFR